MEANILKDGIGQVVFAASGDETRPVLTGVFANFSGDKVTFACADSFRLAVKTSQLAETTTNNFSVILPARAMQELSHVLPSDESKVEISVTANKSQALFKTETVSFTSSLIEGNFPNYQQIIPKSYETRTVIATDQLLKAVKQAALFARDNGNNIVRVSITPGEDITPGSLTLVANATEIGDSHGEIDATVDGQAAEIAFNAKFMQDVLSVMETGQVALELQTSSNPGVFKPVGKDDYIYVIMPMHLANR
jgi:DNA polymerase-3 subunit beta